MQEFIVREASNTWRDGRCADMPLIAKFEWMVNANRALGYELHSFTLNRMLTGENSMNETIIAVFRRMA